MKLPHHLPTCGFVDVIKDEDNEGDFICRQCGQKFHENWLEQVIAQLGIRYVQKHNPELLA